MNDIYLLPKKITEIDVSTPMGHSARLIFNHGSYQLVYDAENSPYVSVTMPPANKLIYQSGAIFPIFEMNIPEGFVRRHIAQRLQRSVGTVSDADVIRRSDIKDRFPELAQAIEQAVSRTMATNNVFVRFDVKRKKRRKIDKLI